jgi:hypothetical protein
MKDKDAVLIRKKGGGGCSTTKGKKMTEKLVFLFATHRNVTLTEWRVSRDPVPNLSRDWQCRRGAVGALPRVDFAHFSPIADLSLLNAPVAPVPCANI